MYVCVGAAFHTLLNVITELNKRENKKNDNREDLLPKTKHCEAKKQ